MSKIWSSRDEIEHVKLSLKSEDKVNSCLTDLAVILLNEIESLSVAFHLIIDIHSKVRDKIQLTLQMTSLTSIS